MARLACKNEHLNLLGPRAPRYTSYPTALHFGPLSYETHSQWIANFEDKEGVGLYVHIPFCKELCWFCGCHTQVTHRYEMIQKYCQSLMDEMILIGKLCNRKLNIHSIHLGGGSPSLLDIQELSALFNKIHEVFDVFPNAEWAIELDPRTLTDDKIQQYKQLGINRVSLGVQDLDETVQLAIHRKFSFSELRQCCERFDAAGIQNINFDLIYGLPYQTLDSLRRTIEQVNILKPQRIALYSFAHLPHSKKHHKMLEPATFPSEFTKGNMYLDASQSLNDFGYQALGIDHFVKPDNNLMQAYLTGQFRRNFMGYTAQANEYVLGIGISAVSQLQIGLSQNTVIRSNYLDAIQHQKLATYRGWIDSQEDILRRFIIQELMCYFEVNIPIVLKKFGYSQDYLNQEMLALRPWADRQVIVIQQGKITFISPLRMLIRSVCAVFDRYDAKKIEGQYSNVS